MVCFECFAERFEFFCFFAFVVAEGYGDYVNCFVVFHDY